MDGLELCRWLRAQSLPRYVYAIFLGLSPDVISGLEAGADDFLADPISEQEMLARLRAGLRVVGLGAPAELPGAIGSPDRSGHPAYAVRAIAAELERGILERPSAYVCHGRHRLLQENQRYARPYGRRV